MKDIGKLFMERTRYEHMEDSDQEKGITQPPVEKAYDHSRVCIELPPANLLKTDKVDLRELIEERKSVRKYKKAALSLQELSYLLWCTQGIKSQLQAEGESGRVVRTLRTVPSAGARHPFETYILANNVEGLAQGLYRYIATKHMLVEMTLEPEIGGQIARACLRQSFVKTSAATFIWTADIYRTTWRYGDRGYRYIHLDAGHVCQNLYLAAESIGCGVCAIAAYEDLKLSALMGLDGEKEFVVYVGTVGKK